MIVIDTPCVHSFVQRVILLTMYNAMKYVTNKLTIVFLNYRNR